MPIVILIVGFLSTFFIVGGGALATVMYSTKGEIPKKDVWLLCTILGLIAAFRDLRSQMQLPPLSNGNVDTLRRLYEDHDNNHAPKKPKL